MYYLTLDAPCKLQGKGENGNSTVILFVEKGVEKIPSQREGN